MKIRICIEPGCKNAQTTKNYCRLHYLKNWRSIKEKEQKSAVDRLNKYVEGIVKKFPDRYVDVIRRELRDEREEGGRDRDDSVSCELGEDLTEGLGIQDDESLDKLISRIKLDKGF